MRPISKIVIVGGGTSGWLAASMLCHHFKRELCQVELIESDVRRFQAMIDAVEAIEDQDARIVFEAGLVEACKRFINGFN